MSLPTGLLRDVDALHQARASGAALVISLDFELHWGVRDVHSPSSRYMANVRGARDAIPPMLDLFAEYGIAATWATVGFLFAESRDELDFFRPAVLPRYRDHRLDPYSEPIGTGEADDPLHFAPSLIRLIASTPRQEIATHTYSHYYCGEPGSTADAFRQDVASAMAIGRAKGFDIKSIVLPRNQWNPQYAPILSEAGIRCFRGNQSGWMYSAAPESEDSRWRRLVRLVDAHLPVTPWQGMEWSEVRQASGLNNVGAACFLRPVGHVPATLDTIRRRRITAAMTRAAIAGRIFHLWWHPHNFGSRMQENLAFLRSIFEQFQILRSEYGMQSLSMLDAALCATVMRTGASGAAWRV